LAHHVCQACGYYKNTEIISQEKEAKGKPVKKEAPKAEEKKASGKEKETQESK
jgi:hypothetical protein